MIYVQSIIQNIIQSWYCAKLASSSLNVTTALPPLTMHYAIIISRGRGFTV